MTRDDIIRMAREAGWSGIYAKPLFSITMQEDDFLRFAALVAAYTISNIDPSKLMSFQEGYAAGVAAEREACSKECEQQLERPSGYQGTWGGYGRLKTEMTGEACAAAIRARGEK